jgi:flagellar protein FliO/FliZ
MMKSIIHIFCSLLMGLLFLAPAMAAETAAVKTSSLETFSIMNMLNMFMGLAVVIALILGLAWVLKKYGKVSGSNVVDMKVLGGLSLGTREKAILIEVDNTRLLVGVTPGHIQTLHILGDNQPAPSSFDETLSKQINKTQIEQIQINEQNNA